MARIFITYRSDDPGWSVLLDRELSKEFGAKQVFRASRSMALGEYFPDRIRAGVSDAAVLLAVIGPRWLAVQADGRRRIDDPTDWVRQEILLALELGLLVVPVLVDGAPTLTVDQLPEELRGLAERQYIRLEHKDADRDLEHLVEQLHDHFRAADGPRHPGLGPAQTLVPAGALILLLAMVLPWADDSTPFTFDWNEWTYGTVLPMISLTFVILLVAVGCLLLGKAPAVAMGLTGASVLLGGYLIAYDVIEVGKMDGVASPRGGVVVYLVGVVVLLVAVGVWVTRERVTPPMLIAPRGQVIGGALAIVSAELAGISTQRIWFTVVVAVVMLAVAAAILLPGRISAAVRTAALTGSVAVGAISFLAAINFLARNHEYGASVGGFTGRIVLQSMAAAGLWIALGRTRPDPH
jgi:hypothetical protein